MTKNSKSILNNELEKVIPFDANFSFIPNVSEVLIHRVVKDLMILNHRNKINLEQVLGKIDSQGTVRHFNVGANICMSIFIVGMLIALVCLCLKKNKNPSPAQLENIVEMLATKT